MLLEELATPIMAPDELAVRSIWYPVEFEVSTTTCTVPVASPPVMPPKVGAKVMLVPGVRNDISEFTTCETVNWEVEVEIANPIAGSAATKAPDATTRMRAANPTDEIIKLRFMLFC